MLTTNVVIYFWERHIQNGKTKQQQFNSLLKLFHVILSHQVLTVSIYETHYIYEWEEIIMFLI